MKRYHDRREFIRKTGAGVTAITLPGIIRAGNSASDMPNILWLVSEDNSPWFGCYGDEFAETPNFDKMAEQGIVFDNAFANAPVCAPARFTIHSGVYASSAGTQHMRSDNPIPPYIRFFTEHLRNAGYFCVNGNKTDYNIDKKPEGSWDGRRLFASLIGMRRKQPFFCFINLATTHESSLHKTRETLHDPAGVTLAPYHPDTPEIRHDYAQYYDQITRLDSQIGKVLEELDETGLSENTIVFYFSDHGGVLPRSKRFLYDSGIKVPMIVRIPERFSGLTPLGPGSRTDRPVSFVDLAPTMLSIAGIKAPEYMQGCAFLGKNISPEPDYVYSFRGRMDERYDSSRAIRDKKYKYIRNFMPHLSYARHLDYLYKMPAMQSWQKEYLAGRLNQVQERFFKPKPMEELYDIESDPHETNNLASDPAYRDVLKKMRKACKCIMTDIHDTALVHEAEMSMRSEGSTPYEMARNPAKYDIESLMHAADTANRLETDNIRKLIEFLGDSDSGVRYWGAVGCVALGKDAEPAEQALLKCLEDPSPSVRVAAAQALYGLGKKQEALEVLENTLEHPNKWAALQAADALEDINEELEPRLQKKKEKAVKRVRRSTNLNALK